MLRYPLQISFLNSRLRTTQDYRPNSWTVPGSPSKTVDRLGLLVRWTVRTSSPGIWGRTIGSPARFLELNKLQGVDKSDDAYSTPIRRLFEGDELNENSFIGPETIVCSLNSCKQGPSKCKSGGTSRLSS